MIDFRELPKNGTAFEQLIREILLVMDLHPQWSGKGADQGRDILVHESATGPIGGFDRKWLVQCKHFAHSAKSVGRNDIGQFVSDCEQVGATGYLLACSTQPSSSLVIKFEETRKSTQNRIAIKTWDAVDIEKMLV